jgi:hypothetical protein
MYANFVESLSLWFESRGNSYKEATFRAGVAFSLHALIFCISVVALLKVLFGVRIVAWVVDHSWSIWLLAAIIAVGHRLVVRNVRIRHEACRTALHGHQVSRYLWTWYLVPILLFFVLAVVLILTSANPPL